MTNQRPGVPAPLHPVLPVPLVPRPRSVRAAGGHLDVAAGLTVVATAEVPDDIVAAVAERLAARAGEGPVPVELVVVTNRSDTGLPDDEPEWRFRQSYRVTIAADGIQLAAPEQEGLIAAASALCQVLEAGTSAPYLEILDAPRFPWRGLSLDVARRFFPVEDVVAVLDILCDLRLNVLHLHLTDDQGWRLEVPSWPALTERSSASGCGGGPGGFYTADDLARITAAAHRRGVVVVPEIDVPGHVNAALHACPDLSPDGVAPPEHTGMEVGFSRLHVGAPATDEFLRDVFGFVAELATGGWVHIGGDEAPAMPAGEYAELVRLAAARVRAGGRCVVAWQEAAGVGLPPGSVVQLWDERTPVDDVVAAVRRGTRLLLSPASKVYLDMKYTDDFPLGLSWAGTTDLRQSYDWDPRAVVPPVAEEDIAGVEACVFSETLRTRHDLTTMLLPRLAAAAEVGWTRQEDRDWQDFARRVVGRGRRWTADGTTWHRSPGVAWA